MNVNFFELTSSEYLALTTVDDKSFYYLTDTEELFQGEKKLSYKEWSGTQAQFETASAAGQIANGTIVTITDSPTPTGDLDTHIATFIHSQSGVHGIRYYQDKLEYYDETSEEWVEIETGGGTTIVQIPSVVIGTYTYNGSEQAPVITGLDAEHTVITGTTASTTPGDFTFTIALKDPTKMVWSDMSITALTYNWSMAKAACPTTVSSDNVTLDADHLTATVTLANVTGEVTVTSSDSTIATAALSGDTITISSVNQASGTATITVSIAESQNYLAGSLTIEVSAEFLVLVSWSTGTDAEIAAMLNAYYNGSITIEDIKSVWSVGQSRTISLSAMEATGVGESHRAQDVEMVILDFEHDNLATAISGHTKAAITVQQKNCLRAANISDTGGSSNSENGHMNSSNTNVGGWTSCARRTWCNNVYYAALPSGFKSMVKEATHQTTAGGQSSTMNTDTDKCFLPSEWEIFGGVIRAKAQEGTQYEYYKTDANRYKLPKWYSSSVSDYWWERSPNGSYWTNFCSVTDSGNAGDNNAGSPAGGLAPACCL